MFRLIGTLVTFCFLAYGSWWVYNSSPTVRSFVQRHMDTGEFLTLEVRYSAEQIMESQKHMLLKDEQHSYRKPSMKFHPYVLLEVKYISDDGDTGEGAILWGLLDGEMVIDANSWEKSHGFEDCINAGALRNDFKVINALAKNDGKLDRESLLNILHVESDMLDRWIESARKKQLIIQRGNDYRLHFQNPRMDVLPETRIDQWLVTKPYKFADRLNKKYSIDQIMDIAAAAFGSDFAVRSYSEVFLPVYEIQVQNPDLTLLTSYWNALNGKRMEGALFLP